MTKPICHYCDQTSTKPQIIITLPGDDKVYNACEFCYEFEYPVDRAAKEAVFAAEVMLGTADEAEVAYRAKALARQASLLTLFPGFSR